GVVADESSLHASPPYGVPRASAVARRIAPAARAPLRMRCGAPRASALCESRENAEVQDAFLAASARGWQTPRSASSWPLRLPAAAEASHPHAAPLRGRWQSPASSTAHRVFLRGRGRFLLERISRPGSSALCLPLCPDELVPGSLSQA